MECQYYDKVKGEKCRNRTLPLRNFCEFHDKDKVVITVGPGGYLGPYNPRVPFNIRLEVDRNTQNWIYIYPETNKLASNWLMDNYISKIQSVSKRGIEIRAKTVHPVNSKYKNQRGFK